MKIIEKTEADYKLLLDNFSSKKVSDRSLARYYENSIQGGHFYYIKSGYDFVYFGTFNIDPNLFRDIKAEKFDNYTPPGHNFGSNGLDNDSITLAGSKKGIPGGRDAVDNGVYDNLVQKSSGKIDKTSIKNLIMNLSARVPAGAPYMIRVLDPKKGTIIFKLFIPKIELFKLNPQLFTTAVKAGELPVKLKSHQEAKDLATRISSTADRGKKTVNSQNISFFSNGIGSAVYRIADLRTLTTNAAKVLRDLAAKIKEYEIILDEPINLALQATKINNLEREVVHLIEEEQKPYAYAYDYVKFKFDKEYNFLGLYLAKASSKERTQIDSQPGPSANAELIISSAPFFNNSTLNSIIFNLSALYNKYGIKMSEGEVQYLTQGSVFYSEETIRMFLNAYVYPKSSIVLSSITRDVIEKFILGDSRLLKEDVYKNSFVDPLQIKDGVRNNLERQVSQQYEAIGDLMGESWISGKFDRIDNVDDLYEQLLNHIDLKEIISISLLCLMKLIPIDELIDLVCKPVLEKFDQHKEKIIQELERMPEGAAKDLASELKEIYFDRIIGQQGLLGNVEGQLETGVRNLPQAIQLASTRHSWLARTTIQTYADLTAANFVLLWKSLTDGEVAPFNWAGDMGSATPGNKLTPGPDEMEKDYIYQGTTTDKTFIYSGLFQKLDRLKERRTELSQESEILTNQLAVFNGVNEPKNLVDLKGYYGRQLSELSMKISSTEASIENGRILDKLYSALLDTVFPHLIALNPYIDNESKLSITRNENTFKDFAFNDEASYADTKPYLTNIPQKSKSILELNSLRIEEVNGDEPIFTFSENTLGKDGYSRQIENGLVPIVKKIQELQQNEQSPHNQLASLEKAAIGSIDDYFFNTDTSNGKPLGIFGDPTKRRFLCLAVIGSVPAAAYAIALAFENLEQAGEFIKNEASAIGNAIDKKIKMLLRDDYPIFDILEEFVDSLKQIALNFSRDLIINGAMYALREIKKACSEEELLNTPINPMGAIDLSNFMSTSKTGLNGQAPGSPDNTDSYQYITTIDPALTSSQFTAILNAISSAFSINQIASLLNGSASEDLYEKAIFTLQELVPTVIKESGAFYRYYVNEEGIIEFFEIIAKDIEPAKIARAQREYRLQKETILEMCVGNDDSLLVDLLGGADARQALANNYAAKREAVDTLMDSMSNMFEEVAMPDPCEMGISTLTESQKFTARLASESIYKNIENDFNSSVVRSKKSFLKGNAALGEYTDLGAGLEGTDTPESYIAFAKNNQNKLTKISERDKIVARELVTSYTKLLKDGDLIFNYEESDKGKEYISFLYENKTALKDINFKFDLEDNKLDFSYSNRLSLAQEQSDEIQAAASIVEYIQANYFGNVINLSNPGSLTPPEILFKPTLESAIVEVPNAIGELVPLDPEDIEAQDPDTGISYQPNYNYNIKDSVNKTLFEKGNDVYLELLNSIFKDLSYYSVKSGLYLKENFDKIRLRKYLTKAKNTGLEGPDIDACFLGFANTEVLHRQTEQIANLLACRSNSATKTPFNMAFVKVLFDCFIRSIALREMMQSFFVLGIFPQDLIFDNIEPDNISLYEKIINFNIAKSVETYTPAEYKEWKNQKLYSYDKFYNNFFKSFIVDITKIMVGKNDITDKQAYDFVINSQIQFIKNQFNQAFTNAFGDLEEIVGITEYQLLSQKGGFSVGGPLPDDNQSFLQLSGSDDFTYNERLRAIQNDGLATWYELTTNRQQPDEDAEKLNYGSTTVFFGGDEIPSNAFVGDIETASGDDFTIQAPAPTSLDIHPRMPFFLRTSSKTATYIDFETFKKTKSNVAKSLSYDNNRGLVLDRFIEIKPNKSAFNADQKKYIENFLLDVGSAASIASGASNPAGAGFVSGFRKALRNFLYETKMFMLFPQAIDFIESLTLEAGPNCLWKQYSQEITQIFYGDGAKYNLLYWLFRYNYDANFFDDSEARNWISAMYQSGFWKKLNLSLMGKVRLGDMYIILEKMMYPVIEADSIDFNMPDWSAYTVEDIEGQKKPPQEAFATVDEYFVNSNTAGSINGDWIYGYRFARFMEYIDVSPSAAAWYRLKQMQINQPNEIFNGLSLFHWLYSKKVNQLLHVNTSIRIDSKVADKDFEISNSLSKELFYQDIDKAQKYENQRVLLEENIGPEGLGDASDDNIVFSSPIFELKQQIPDNITWFEFFVNVDKDSYFNDEEFYKVLNPEQETISSDDDINNYLFAKNKKDLYSYFYRLKTFSTTVQKKIVVVEKKQFNSTYWWNLYGRPVPLHIILKAIYLDLDGDWDAAPIVGVGAGSWGKELPWHLIREALTDHSLLSFESPTSIVQERISQGVILDSDYQIANINSDRRNFYIKSGDGSAMNDYEYYNLVKKTMLEIVEHDKARKDIIDFVWDKENEDFKDGFNPFISIREKNPAVDNLVPGGWVDFGFYNFGGVASFDFDNLDEEVDSQGPNGKSLEKQLPGSMFEPFEENAGSAVIRYVTRNNTSHPPLGPSPEWFRPFSHKDDQDRVTSAFFYEADSGGADAFTPNSLRRSFWVKGGVASATKEILGQPVNGGTINIYDLFLMILGKDKEDNNKKDFEKLLKTFFIKEQTTIIALIHRILTETEHPSVSLAFNNTIEQCYRQLSTAVAAANGDYQTSPPEETDYAEAAAKIGGRLLKGFLKAIASTVDPTWQTPWFLPGPLTPFGITAKLLEEEPWKKDDGEDEEDNTVGELVCPDSLESSIQFFEEFSKTWANALGGAEAEKQSES